MHQLPFRKVIEHRFPDTRQFRVVARKVKRVARDVLRQVSKPAEMPAQACFVFHVENERVGKQHTQRLLQTELADG